MERGTESFAAAWIENLKPSVEKLLHEPYLDLEIVDGLTS